MHIAVRGIFVTVMVLAGALLTDEGRAAPFEREKLPPVLAGWADWVLHEVPDHVCPVVDGAAICLWPGRLSLDLNDQGGRFTYEVLADREIPVALPGSRSHWPEQVRIDGKEAIVSEMNRLPMSTVGPGAHRVEGRFVWTALPEGIKIPPTTALISLTVRGAAVPFPRRDGVGLLWLMSASGDDESEKLGLSVMRRIADAVPLTVETRIDIRASGKAREAALGKVLLADTVPLSVTADIPARLDNEGNLDIQVRPGTHTVTVMARTKRSPETIAAPPGRAPWPTEETWVWQADEKLRQVTVSGAPGIDPSRTDLPEEWRRLPAYLMAPGASLVLKATRRGEPEPPPDQLTVNRTLWMDIDGTGFTVQDRISGTLNRAWRLDLAPPGRLGRVSIGGVDQLITAGTGKQTGVELRDGALDMAAEWRLEQEGRRPMAASGWSQDIQALDMWLHLPPGWTLLTARGVDELHDTWWDKWDLFSFFFVLIISIAIGKLTRRPFGLIALVALVLAQHEAEAPFAVWVSLLVTLALLKVLPRGKLLFADKLLWWTSVIWLAAVLVPFSVTQVRTGLFPQVGAYGAAGYGAGYGAGTPSPIGGPDLSKQKADQEVSGLRSTGGGSKADVRMRKLPIRGQLFSQGLDFADEGRWNKPLSQDPQAVVQTGPGVPSWQWRSWHLSWSGPVSAGHSFELFLISPQINLFLSILRVVLLVLIALRIVVEGFRVSRDKKAGAPPPVGAAVAGAVVLLGALLSPFMAKADAVPDDKVPPRDGLPSAEDIPGVSILDELRDRLVAPAPCQPDCVSSSKLHIDIADEMLTIEAEVHAEARSSFAIPGPANNWMPQMVSIDGRATEAMVAGTDGFLRVRLEKGVYRLVVRGPLPQNGALTLEFNEVPKRVTASLAGWMADGIGDDGHPESSIQLTRQVVKAAGAREGEGFEEGAYPPWLEVTRTLDLGVQWSVYTTVRRVSPLGSPVVANVPLIPGESVTASGVTVEKGQVVVSLGRNDETTSWSSTLKPREKIDLVAPGNVPWSEVWTVACRQVWACRFDALSPTQRKEGTLYQPTFRPRPGERLAISARKPAGAPGQSTTIDSATLSFSPGKRLVKALLTLVIRASRGGEQTITLPRGAEVQTLRVDGAEQPFRKEGNKIAVTLKPGGQTIEASWQQEGGITSVYQAPAVGVGGRATNVTVTVNLPQDRWLVLLGGPSWGPAVLYWGFLLTILLAGLILGRAKLSPIRSWQWMLLALGLTQVPVPAALVIVVWFFAMAWRAANPLPHVFLHNGLQIVLGLLTLGALGALIAAVYSGLAVQPDMQVAGSGSTDASLNWYTDHINGSLPTPWILSLPLLVWKIVMLLWALWLAGSIVKWAPFAWHAYTAGTIWRRRPKPAGTAGPESTPAQEGSDSTEAAPL